MQKIVIAGGTGFIGSYLEERFKKSGYRVLLVSRQEPHVHWQHSELTKAVNEAALVLNLAGTSINCRHNAVNKKEILQSRLSSTQMIGNAILASKIPPKLWINASAAAIYKQSEDKAMTEDETDLSNDFLADVVHQWEQKFFSFQLPTTRKVALRTSLVLGKEGGALKPLLTLSQFGLGGTQASGNQIMSWIHIEDYFRIVLFLLEQEGLEGVYNCTSPNPVSNKEFMSTIRKNLHVPMGLPAPAWIIRIGAKIIGTESSLILNSSYLMPKNLMNSKFRFTYPELDKALFNLLLVNGH
jgi:uncharacterized protein (TIGR01777 family)